MATGQRHEIKEDFYSLDVLIWKSVSKNVYIFI